ncbi:MAG: TolC family protein, partial [Cytophagaceae bacterium]
MSGSYLRLAFANIDLKQSGGNGGAGSPSAAPVNPSQVMFGMATASMPLYAGGRIKYGIASAEYLQQAVRLDADVDKDAVVYNTSMAYVNLFKAQEAVAIVKAELNASLSRDSNLVNLERNGILARNDLLKSQLQTSNIETTVLEAENNLALATVNMNLMLGRPENTPISIDSSFTMVAAEEKTFVEYESLALQNRKDVQAIALRKKASAIGIKAAKAEAYPTLALSGGYVAAHIP